MRIEIKKVGVSAKIPVQTKPLLREQLNEWDKLIAEAEAALNSIKYLRQQIEDVVDMDLPKYFKDNGLSALWLYSQEDKNARSK